MKAGIITIGDELLLGQTINTNLAKIGKGLSDIGITIVKSTTIRDVAVEIIEALDSFLKNTDLVIVTGGLGPTNDDLTKETLTHYFKTELILDEDVLEHVRHIFESRGREMLPSNIHQAMVPKECVVLKNDLGTAPGMWFKKGEQHIISLPGVPYEMINLLDNTVIPKLKEQFNLTGKYYQTMMIQGIGESFLAKKIENWENRTFTDGLHLAYLPTPGLIRLRLETEHEFQDKGKIASYIKELKEQLPQYIYGMNDESIYEVVGELLRKEKATLGTVESCTGGGIANAFITYSGASDYFQGSLVTYSNQLKMELAGVSSVSLESKGAVSEIVAKEMAVGGKKRLGVDYCIAVTGIAGPTGGTKEKPVGTIWIAVATPEEVIAKQFRFGDDRGRNIEITKLSAANLLRKCMLKIHE